MPLLQSLSAGELKIGRILNVPNNLSLIKHNLSGRIQGRLKLRASVKGRKLQGAKINPVYSIFISYDKSQNNLARHKLSSYVSSYE